MAKQKTTSAWMVSLEPTLREIAEALVQCLMDADPELNDSIKWGNPVYEKQGMVCYLAATKSYVSLGFFKGTALADSEGFLEGTGKKMCHVKVRNLSDIRSELLTNMVREAVTLNQNG